MIKIIIKEIKSAYKDMNKPLFICTVILFIFGLANILTASSREAVVESGATMTYYFNKQLFVIACSFIPVDPYRLSNSVLFIFEYIFIVPSGKISLLPIFSENL